MVGKLGDGWGHIGRSFPVSQPFLDVAFIVSAEYFDDGVAFHDALGCISDESFGLDRLTCCPGNGRFSALIPYWFYRRI